MKFRVWSLAYKRYFTDDFLIDSDGYLFENERGELTQMKSAAWLAEFCTGFQDKNGKEIYEGDVIKVSYSVGTDCVSAACEQAGTVFWCETYLQYQYSGFDCALTELDSIEVIGNIHQNPELLEN